MLQHLAAKIYNSVKYFLCSFCLCQKIIIWLFVCCYFPGSFQALFVYVVFWRFTTQTKHTKSIDGVGLHFRTSSMCQRDPQLFTSTHTPKIQVRNPTPLTKSQSTPKIPSSNSHKYPIRYKISVYLHSNLIKTPIISL